MSKMLPEWLVAQWHPTRNEGLSPDRVTVGSNRKVWWLGECGHEWVSRVFVRVKGAGCSVCSGKMVVPGVNDLTTTHPVLADEWHPTRNEGLSPSQVTVGSNRKVWWLGECGHEWEAKICNRVKSSGKITSCPVCVNKQVVAGFNDLKSQVPSLVEQWHPTKNGNITPDSVMVSSSKKVWWVCDKGHEWEAPVSNRSRKGHGCPYCAGLHHGDAKHIQEFLVSEWHPVKNEDLKPEDVSKGSDRKVWWLGPCGHEWEATVSSRALGKRGCGYCSNNRVLEGFNDLATLFPKLAAEFHPVLNTPYTAADFVAGSGKPVHWLCSECNHEWEAVVSSRVYGNGCPECAVRKLGFVSKPEKELFALFTGLGLVVEQSNRKVLGNRQEIDLYFPDQGLGVEFNGLYWHSEAAGKGRNYHYDKWLAAKEAGVQLLQVWEDDWRDRKPVLVRAIAHKLGVSDRLAEVYPEFAGSASRVFARQTKVVELLTGEAQQFLNENHIQGFSSGSYYLGLRDIETQNLVAVLVLKKEAGTNGRTLNIIRYATSGTVVGGFTKLLKHAERTYAPDKFITFADHCISDGGLYEKNGFIADKELPPDYMYVVDGVRKHKFGYRLKKFRDDPNLIWEEGLSERELARLNNLPRIWDAGKTRWVKQLRK